MNSLNIDIKDKLINNQVGQVFGFRIVDNAINKTYIKLQDPKIGRKVKLPNEFKRTNCVVPTEKCEADIPILNDSVSPSIKWIQIRWALSWACTIHKVQSMSLEGGVTNFDLKKQKCFGPGQM